MTRSSTWFSVEQVVVLLHSSTIAWSYVIWVGNHDLHSRTQCICRLFHPKRGSSSQCMCLLLLTGHENCTQTSWIIHHKCYVKLTASREKEVETCSGIMLFENHPPLVKAVCIKDYIRVVWGVVVHVHTYIPEVPSNFAEATLQWDWIVLEVNTSL